MLVENPSLSEEPPERRCTAADISPELSRREKRLPVLFYPFKYFTRWRSALPGGRLQGAARVSARLAGSVVSRGPGWEEEEDRLAKTFAQFHASRCSFFCCLFVCLILYFRLLAESSVNCCLNDAQTFLIFNIFVLTHHSE